MKWSLETAEKFAYIMAGVGALMAIVGFWRAFSAPDKCSLSLEDLASMVLGSVGILISMLSLILGITSRGTRSDIAEMRTELREMRTELREGFEKMTQLQQQTIDILVRIERTLAGRSFREAGSEQI